MRSCRFISILVRFSLVILATGTWAQVLVTNLVVAQRPGTKLVDITYDVTNTTAGFMVSTSLAVSNAGIPVSTASLSGDSGLIAPGIGKAIAWDMSADWNGKLSVLSFTLTAVASPVPTGGDPNAISWVIINDRWVKNTYADGAVTMSDRNAAMMWFYDASAIGATFWDNAFSASRWSYAGYYNWRLPVRTELQFIYQQQGVFTGVQPAWYWSGEGSSVNYCYAVSMVDGSVISSSKSEFYWVLKCRAR